MKANYRNYFKDGKLYSWDKNKDIFAISNTDIKEEFCLDQKGMELFLNYKNPEITLDGKLKVKSGKLKSSINVITEELIVPNLEFENTFKLNIDKLKLASKFVDVAQGRIVLTGVNIRNNYITATDSFFAYRSECENDCNIIVSKGFIEFLSTFKGDIEFKANKNLIACEIDGTTYIGKLIAGAYPNMESIYKNIPNLEVKLNKKELKDFIQMSNEKGGFITLDKNLITISGVNESELEIELPIECKISFSLDKLLSTINCIENEEITINYNEPIKPIFINNEFLLLPVRKD